MNPERTNVDAPPKRHADAIRTMNPTSGDARKRTAPPMNRVPDLADLVSMPDGDLESWVLHNDEILHRALGGDGPLPRHVEDLRTACACARVTLRRRRAVIPWAS